MTKILFICHGNICRSPMAEFAMKDLVRRRGVAGRYVIASAAVSREALGSPVYGPARRELARHGIGCAGKTAVQVAKADYAKYDYLVYMENSNLPRLMGILGGDPAGKCRRLLDFTGQPGDIADPWYTGDFALAYAEIAQGCQAMLDNLEAKHGV